MRVLQTFLWVRRRLSCAPSPSRGGLGWGWVTWCISPIPLLTSPLKGEENTACAARFRESFDPHKSRMNMNEKCRCGSVDVPRRPAGRRDRMQYAPPGSPVPGVRGGSRGAPAVPRGQVTLGLRVPPKCAKVALIAGHRDEGGDALGSGAGRDIRTRRTGRNALAEGEFLHDGPAELKGESDRPAAAPGSTRMRDYPRQWLRADVTAGLIAAAVVVPKAMAFARWCSLR
jgi:hypothetical protein